MDPANLGELPTGRVDLPELLFKNLDDGGL